MGNTLSSKKNQPYMMEDLTKTAEELDRIISDMEKQVNRAREAKEEIDEQVNKWLEEAYNMRSKLTYRINSSRDDVSIRKTTLSDLVARGKSILCVSFPGDPEGIELVWREGFIDFKSRRGAYDQIMSCLKGEDVSTIGIFGMGGIGKTKLVVEIGKKAKDDKLFDHVIIATVSQDPKIRDIQETLAYMLNPRFQNMTESGRANELCARMKGKEKILVILDDIWKKIDLETIGIPSDFRNKASKIIFTTRREEVCKDMGCTSTLCLDVIDEDEAWALFSKYAGLRQRPHIFKSKGKQIVSKCAGLPLAIVTVGSSLRNKTFEYYEKAAEKLSKPAPVSSVRPESDDGVGFEACFELSYDYLEDEFTKECFLLCSFFPEDRAIKMELLTRYAYGLGWFQIQNADSVDLGRRMMITSVQKLIDACLIFHDKDIDSNQNKATVKMHDVVRDFALRKASDKYGYLLTSLPQITDKKFQEKAFAVVLNWYLDSLPSNQLHCTNLKILLMFEINIYTSMRERFNSLMVPKKNRLPDGFFNETTTLQVLHMRTGEESLPDSLQCLVNLRTLILFGDDERDNDEFSMIQNLKNLEILQLKGNRIKRRYRTILPEWIGKLYNLRLLDLSSWTSVTEIPRYLLSSLTKLEEFYGPYTRMGKSDYMSDLMLLPRLTVFTGWFRKQVSLPDDFNIKMLQKYCISYTHDLHHHKGWSKILGLYCEDESSVTRYEQFWSSVEHLWIKGAMQGVFNICPQLDTTGFENLRELRICNNENLKYVIGLPNLTVNVLPNLVKLMLDGMKHLVKICNELPPPHYMGKLRYATIKDCPVLSNLFLAFGTQLEELDIYKCDALEYVYEAEAKPFQHTAYPSPKIVIKLSDLKKLQRIWKGPYQLGREEREELINEGVEVVDSSGVPVTIKIYDCDELEEVFPHLEYCNNWKYIGQFSNLAELDLSHLPKLKCIWQGTPQNYSLHKLVRIELQRCDSLTSLFTSTLAKSLRNLQELVIVKCGSLETIVMQDDSCESGKGPDGTSAQSSFQDGYQVLKDKNISLLPELKTITLEQLPCLSRICPQDYIFSCQTFLRQTMVVIENCEILVDSTYWREDLILPNIRTLSQLVNLSHLRHIIVKDSMSFPKYLFPRSIAQALSSLEILKVFNCKELETLIEPQDDRFVQASSSSASCFPQLIDLRIKGCDRLKNIFPRSIAQALSSLEKLEVFNCKELETLIEPQDDRCIQASSSSASCFPQLTLLRIEGCDKFKNIFPLSLARHFPRLKYVQIERVPLLKNIFFKDREEECAGCNLIELPALECIDLVNLPLFCGLCPAGYILNCPQFTSRRLRLNLRAFVDSPCMRVVRSNIDVLFEFEEKVVTRDEQSFPFNFRSMWLKDLSNLTCIWKGPSESINLFYLKSLTLSQCGSQQMKSLFTRTVAQTLQSLETLYIYDCKELEHLIEPLTAREPPLLSETNNSLSTCFPRLKDLLIEGCDKLKTVFPLSIARHFPELCDIYLIGARELEEIFTEDRNEEDTGFIKLIKLPELTILHLEKLPCMSRLCPPGYALCCPTPLYDFTIDTGCPFLDSTTCFPHLYRA